jgi:hypothetical protein
VLPAAASTWRASLSSFSHEKAQKNSSHEKAQNAQNIFKTPFVIFVPFCG